MQLRGLRKEKHKIPVYPIAKQNPKERFLTLLNCGFSRSRITLLKF